MLQPSGGAVYFFWSYMCAKMKLLDSHHLEAPLFDGVWRHGLAVAAQAPGQLLGERAVLCSAAEGLLPEVCAAARRSQAGRAAVHEPLQQLSAPLDRCAHARIVVLLAELHGHERSEVEATEKDLIGSGQQSVWAGSACLGGGGDEGGRGGA